MRKAPLFFITEAMTVLCLLVLPAPPIEAYPVAVLYADPLAGPAPLMVEFSGSDSWDTRGLPIVRYTWNFNDGSPIVSGEELACIRHLFKKPGDYHVYLTVFNRYGHSKTAYQLIRVFALPLMSTLSPAIPATSAFPFHTSGR